MKYIKKVITFDGKLHKNERDAKHYLDVMYSDEMSRVAAKLCQYSEGKHVRTMDWLDENLSEFIRLKEIKDDMQMNEQDI